MLLSGCSFKNESNGQLDLSRSIGGSTVGNGMSEYTNSFMGIQFRYPVSWNLTEVGNNRIHLSDNNQLKSFIEFSLNSEIAGHHFTSIDDLENYLKTTFPEKEWLKTVVLQHDGFYTISTLSDLTITEYYILDSNFNVMEIIYNGYESTGGLGIIKSIIRQLSIDNTGPVIRQLSFDKSAVLPGDTVTLTIVADDLLSDIDLYSMNSHTIIGCGNGQEFSALGYNEHDAEWKKSTLYCAYPINNIEQVSDSVFKYVFKVPENAPAGEIQLQTLRIADVKGNISQIYIYEKNDVSYSYSSHLLPVIKFQVMPKLDIVEDRKGPEIRSMYFEKSKVYKNDPKQKLFFKITDSSLIRLDNFSIGIGTGVGCGGNVDKQLHKVDVDLYYTQFDLTECFNDDRTYGNLHAGSILPIIDEVGNAHQKYTNPIPFFELVK